MSNKHRVASAVKKSVGKGAQFLKDHPFFGDEALLPKTVKLAHELATKLDAGTVTSDDAEAQINATVNEEIDSLPTDKQEKIMTDAMLAALLGDEPIAA